MKCTETSLFLFWNVSDLWFVGTLWSTLCCIGWFWEHQQTSPDWEMNFLIGGGFCSHSKTLHFTLIRHPEVIADGDSGRIWIDPYRVIHIPGEEWHHVINSLKKDCKTLSGNTFHDYDLVFNFGHPTESVIYVIIGCIVSVFFFS